MIAIREAGTSCRVFEGDNHPSMMSDVENKGPRGSENLDQTRGRRFPVSTIPSTAVVQPCGWVSVPVDSPKGWPGTDERVNTFPRKKKKPARYRHSSANNGTDRRWSGADGVQKSDPGAGDNVIAPWVPPRGVHSSVVRHAHHYGMGQAVLRMKPQLLRFDVCRTPVCGK